MGPNPMQKMKRNAILIGLIIGLVIGLIMCGCLYIFLTKFATSTGIAGGTPTTVCVLNKNIKAGTKITEADIITKSVTKENSPSDATMQVLNSTAKIDLSTGTILTAGMINKSAETLTADLREQEYNMISLPSDLSTGDFIDIRLQLPNGGDYIVISKKQIIKCNSTSIWLNMYEEELDIMSNAIIEYYIMTGSKLYAIKYTDPGLQTAAVGTYVPNASVVSLIQSNPNIKGYINSERYSDALKSIRNSSINSALAQYYTEETEKTEALKNLEEKLQEEIKAIKESREAYFGSLDSIK